MLHQIGASTRGRRSGGGAIVSSARLLRVARRRHRGRQQFGGTVTSALSPKWPKSRYGGNGIALLMAAGKSVADVGGARRAAYSSRRSTACISACARRGTAGASAIGMPRASCGDMFHWADGEKKYLHRPSSKAGQHNLGRRRNKNRRLPKSAVVKNSRWRVMYIINSRATSISSRAAGARGPSCLFCRRENRANQLSRLLKWKLRRARYSVVY